MDFLLAMSIYSPTRNISSENQKAEERTSGWAARDDKKGATGEPQQPQVRGQQEEKTQQRHVRGPQEEKTTQQQRRRRFALEFDGLHCFETIVSH